jgi:hypothetical protein
MCQPSDGFSWNLVFGIVSKIFRHVLILVAVLQKCYTVRGELPACLRLSSLGVVSLYNGDGVVFSLVYRPRLKEQLSMDRRLCFKVDCYWMGHNCSMEHETLSTLPETDCKSSRLQYLR